MTARDEIDGKKLTRWYDAQARFYSMRRDDFSGSHVQQVARTLDSSKSLQILDAGCGTGLITIGLAQQCERWQLLGYDASSGMIDVGRRHATDMKLSNARFETGDVLELPYRDGQFDVVTAAGLFPNLNDPAPALTQFHRVLKPGGRLFVIEVDPDGMSAWNRLTFRTMILGYRIVSSFLPQFKFAKGWSLERTTLRSDLFAQSMRSAGFSLDAPVEVGQHWILDGRRA